MSSTDLCIARPSHEAPLWYTRRYMKRNTIIVAVVAFVVIIGIPMGIWWQDRKTPGKLDTFAQCIADSGATFYGAFWCPHCQAQKKMFGKSQSLLPYVECSAPNGKDQLPICKEKNITGYPTWEFADGTRESGEVPLEKLAEKTNCVLPGSAS